MAARVAELPAAAQGERASPLAASCANPRLPLAGLHVRDIAHIAALQALAHVGVARAEAPLEADHHVSVKIVRVISNLLRELGRMRQGLLAQHVGAGVEGAHHVLVVQCVGSRHQHHIRVGCRQEVTPIGVGGNFIQARQAGPCARNRCVGRIGQANHVDLGHRRKPPQVTGGIAANANGAKSVWHGHRAVRPDGRKSTSTRRTAGAAAYASRVVGSPGTN